MVRVYKYIGPQSFNFVRVRIILASGRLFLCLTNTLFFFGSIRSALGWKTIVDGGLRNDKPCLERRPSVERVRTPTTKSPWRNVG
jgi:hypothetical protein